MTSNDRDWDNRAKPSRFIGEYVVVSLGVMPAENAEAMSVTNALAVLAPVPLEHLESGYEVCQNNGKVAYGSNAWELFSRLDALRKGVKVHTLFYASGTKNTIGIKASWQATYIGFVECRHASGVYEAMYRPPTTKQYPNDNKHGWAIFWEVEDLHPLANPIPIYQLRGLKKKKPFGLDFIPEGPMLIECHW